MGEIVVLGGNGIVAQYFGDFKGSKGQLDENHQEWPFFVRCAVPTYCPPRHSRFEYFRDMGMPIYEDLFAGNAIPETNDLVLMFPERWISHHEQRWLIHVVGGNPNASKIGRVSIVTQSALVVGSMPNGSVISAQWKDDPPAADDSTYPFAFFGYKGMRDEEDK